MRREPALPGPEGLDGGERISRFVVVTSRLRDALISAADRQHKK
ncbi:hypothetical protein [Actinopolymorpha pittospori]|uniref:Uncharacterized protein n=1 Tax=Actinopolymorpha pittospori TaxID=648752 RepID=A0A927MNS7_9ACTN|nr:hypothetical protein [Actinopolymorpha pittospori]MBE1604101.1 hypothetical protein [Actinopolymorpha pittospori]